MNFGTDGIRGRVGVTITAELALAVGNAMVQVCGPTIAVARDTRPSGPMLMAATIAGICAAGGEAVDLGVLPTPGLSALVPRLRLAGGIMITASHNPAADNGLKAVDGTGEKIDADTRHRLEQRLGARVHVEAPGGVRTIEDAGERYVQAVLDALPTGRWLAGRTIVADSANGAARGLAGRVLSALGARVISIGDGDGAAINHNCGALHPGALVAAVRSHEAYAGIALDGDGDRGALVLADGQVLDGDALLWLTARGEVVIGTIMSNGGLEAGLAARGIRLVRTAVGDAHVAAAMRETGAAVGGEPSGHVLFADGLPTADGLLTALRALHVDNPAARLAELPVRAQLNTTVKVPAERVPATAPLVDALRTAGARVVVRPSGTEPVIRIMVEHADPDVARSGLDRLRAALEEG